jgi:hypothetical protein
MGASVIFLLLCLVVEASGIAWLLWRLLAAQAAQTAAIAALPRLMAIRPAEDSGTGRHHLHHRLTQRGLREPVDAS